jgi:hypothetical protein
MSDSKVDTDTAEDKVCDLSKDWLDNRSKSHREKNGNDTSHHDKGIENER